MPDYTNITRLRQLAALDEDPAFRGNGWHAPRDVTIDGDALRPSPDMGDDLVLPRGGLLSKFVRLEHAGAEEVAAFARRWGRLNLCEHGLPVSHHQRVPRASGPPMRYSPRAGLPSVPIPVAANGEAELEPFENWRYLARQMGAVLEAASRLRLGQVPSLDVWEQAGGKVLRGYVVRFGAEQPELLPKLAISLTNLHMDIAAPRLQVGGAGMSVGGGLAVALAVQLSLAVVRQETDFLPCSTPGCTNPAVLPRQGATPYCGDCLASGARNRDSQQRHRERLRGRATGAASNT